MGELVTLSWSIDTAGTHAVLRTASANIDAQNTAARTLGTSLSGLGAVLGNSIVAKALNDYVEQSLAPDLASIAGKSAGIVQGTNDALIAYVQADFHMARDAQASALASGAPVFDAGRPPQRAGRDELG